MKNITTLASFGEIVLVGGDVRPANKATLEKKLGTKIHWVGTTPQGCVLRLEETIRLPDVVIICLLIRWSRHKFTQSVPKLCKKHQKAFVRIPSGCGATQLEFQIRNQVSKRQTKV